MPGGPAPPDLNEEEDPLLPGAADAKGEPSPLRRPRLVALLAVSAAAAAAVARWAPWRGAQDGHLAVRRTKDFEGKAPSAHGPCAKAEQLGVAAAGAETSTVHSEHTSEDTDVVFALSRGQTGCKNWRDIQLGSIRFVCSPEACAQVCQTTKGCVGFGFQENACDDEAMGARRAGACMLWKQPCEEASNVCWDDYVLAPLVASGNCEVPEPPDFGPGGRGCPEAAAQSCLNGNGSYGVLGEAWRACGILPECAVVLKALDGRYYLRRTTDPEIAAGESATYSCKTSPPSTTTVSETTVTRTLVKHIKVTEDLHTFKIDHLEYEMLLENPDLYAETLEEIKKSVAEEYGVSPDAVEIELTSR